MWCVVAAHVVEERLRAAIDAPAWVGSGDFGLRHAGQQWAERFEARARHCGQGTTNCEGLTALRELFWQKERGVAVELGGLDGIQASETLPLETIADFRRVVVEAGPSHRERRLARAPDVAGVEAAVCRVARPVHYLLAHYFQEIQGIAEFMSPAFLEEFHPRVHDAWANASFRWDDVEWRRLDDVWRADDATSETRAPWVRRFQGRRVKLTVCFSLTAIFEALGIHHVDFFLLDVEGAELQVLHTLDFDRISFGCICVETNSPRGTRSPAYRSAVLDFFLTAAPAYVPWAPSLLIDTRNSWFCHRNMSKSRRAEAAR